MDNSIPYFEDEFSAMKPGIPIVERDAINAIVYNRTNDEVLCLDWAKFGWRSFIIGGIEGEEDSVAAALREISEETGYRDLKFIARLGRTRSGCYAAHKGVNRISNATGLLFELISNSREEVLGLENLPHTFIWIKRSEVSSFINLTSQKYIWEKAQEYLDK